MTTAVATQLICNACQLPAVLDTPYGVFCLDHTLEVMDADAGFWMPHIIDPPVATDR
jgi:hypothetical protein